MEILCELKSPLSFLDLIGKKKSPPSKVRRTLGASPVSYSIHLVPQIYLDQTT